MMRDRINTALRRIPAWVIYAMAPLPVIWLVWQGFIGGLGVEPIRALEHELGEIGLQLLLAGLCVTPLRRYLGLNLLKFRRALGLVAFFYITLHLLVWLVLDVQIPAQIWADIVKRPYITVGMLAFVLMVPLALTSNNASVRRLGARWRWLHWLTYPVAVLGALHFVLLAKGFQIEPLIYLALALLLVALRGRGLWPWPVKPRGRAQAS
ncbi:protein-methionine-sulfoxide reductase heme-binding subunit MsrQ [Salipiger marinus]|uniref:protein-methionine-sulfoxide reductase heme-binding subunit MsrQ n=1 Tax=Salipiger marinus TaxID=555512 RepID=UPI001E5DFB34|nr:protein-methionine-sulfoxide reductase heme-binding subunit MsrQ [Salipiger manganoxidans]MCD1617487.1 protein-methionine-sulfoxide reductase heme-binding subunit MsrQ [Salipiger manganoxidans]MEB3417542.1 protein-methionine-sulfoxide reductase heme-binding subunit MsrQ [Salipiger manganoxidans]